MPPSSRGSISVETTADTSQLAADLRTKLTEVLRSIKPLEVPVKADIEEFTRDINRKLRDAQNQFASEGEKAGSGFGDKLTGNLNRSLSGLTDSSSRLRSVIGGALEGLGAVGKFTVLTAVLTQSAVAAGQFASALAPAAGIVGALPAAVLVGAAALGTLKLALFGVGDALKAGLEGDTAKFNEALKNLAPAAQDTVKEIVALKPGFDELRTSVQGAFFEGLAGEVRQLAQVFFPVLQKQLPAIAGSLRQFVTEFSGVAQQPEVVSALNDVLASTSVALGRASEGVGPLTRGLALAAQVGAPFIEQFGGALGDLATRFGDFLTEAAQTGQLEQIIQGAIDTFRTLGEIASNVGGIFSSIFSAASSSGGSVLDILAQLTGQLNAFLQSAQGAQLLQTVFTSLAQIGAVISSTLGVVLPIIGAAFVAILPAIVAVVTALGSIIQAVAPAIPILATLVSIIAGQFATVLTSLAPILGTIAVTIANGLGQVLPALASAFLQVVSAIAPLLPPIVQLISQLVTGLIPAITPLIVLFGEIAAQIGGVLIQALTVLLPPIIQVVSIISASLQPVLKVLSDAIIQVLNALLPLLPPIGELFLAVAPLIPIIADLAATIIGALVPILVPLIELVVSLATRLLSILAPALNFIVTTITGPVIGALSSIIGFLGKVIGTVVGFAAKFIEIFTSIQFRIVGVIGDIASFLFGAGKRIIQSLIDGVTSMIGRVIAVIGNVVQKIRDFLPFSPAKIGAFSGSGAPEIAGRKIVQGIADGIRTNQGAILTAMDQATSSLESSIPSFAAMAPDAVNAQGIRVWPAQPSGDAAKLVIESGGTKLDDLLVEVLSNAVRVRGGEVQRVLGANQGVAA